MKQFGILINLFLLSGQFPHCLTKGDAEKILGQPATLAESSSSGKDGVEQHLCTYTAASADTKTKKTGNVYYLVEFYNNASAAHDSFAFIVSQNQGNPGNKMISGLGDEAWSHTDDSNFYLIMVRKGNRMLRIKVNKLTSLTSIDNLLKVTANLTASL